MYRMFHQEENRPCLTLACQRLLAEQWAVFRNHLGQVERLTGKLPSHAEAWAQMKTFCQMHGCGICCTHYVGLLDPSTGESCWTVR
jgi:hypothetical protein